MSNYCAVADVEALEAGRQLVFADYVAPDPGPPVVAGTAATRPSLTQVTEWITEVSAQIDETILRSGYQVPITGNIFLKQCAAMGVAYYVELALTTKGDADSSGNRQHRYTEFMRMLDNLKKDPRIAGAVSANGQQNAYATSDGVKHFTNQNPNVSFHINEKDW